MATGNTGNPGRAGELDVLTLELWTGQGESDWMEAGGAAGSRGGAVRPAGTMNLLNL
jgi:hypothetical protein